MYSDYGHERIAYSGIFPSKKSILQKHKILSYSDLIEKKNYQKKYRTVKSLFRCVEIPRDKKIYFNSYHLTTK